MARFGGKVFWLTLAVFIGLAGYYGYTVRLDHLYTEYRQSANEVQALHEQSESLTQEADRLERRVEDMKHDPIEMEAAIRQRRNLVRPGETVYKVELEKE